MTISARRFFTIVAIALMAIPLYAQKIEGVATYQTKTTLDMSRFNRGGEQMTEQRKKQIAERMKNFLEKEFTLTFNKEESFYKEEEKLQAPGQGGGRWGGGFTQGGIYKNATTKDYARENNMMGKTFLVKDTVSTLQWELTKESKMIGQYPAFKAVAERPIEANMWSRMGRMARDAQKKQEKKDSTAVAENSDEIEVEEEEPTTETITAWYTPMIPVGHGPDEFGGLPGLILELSTNNTTMLCTKVVLNPKDAIVIDVPSKGKEVSREEYTTIVEEKAKEMAERFQSSGRRGQQGGRRF
ncbi:GLPGLI family protein [Dokdonia sinensis]|uniref:GLPGLI family protein n=1 Tax=Dokdonia sinensis TaxID=2479847 RepID=A0A3M0G434_9FLAO|nr:GLPGLI family protein [Dokdonia sinensis]RMB56663.1 GLPGLI family protein [Dokdonia sinensis]